MNPGSYLSAKENNSVKNGKGMGWVWSFIEHPVCAGYIRILSYLNTVATQGDRPYGLKVLCTQGN